MGKEGKKKAVGTRQFNLQFQLEERGNAVVDDMHFYWRTLINLEIH